MKKNIILLIVIAFGLSSCFEDNSALNYKMINPIRLEIDKDKDVRHYVYALDTLRITPLVYKEGVSDDDLEFLWELSGNLIMPTKLSDKRSLKVEMNFAPESNAYNLLYRVTDKTTGIFVEQVYEVTIQSPFGTGLIVCDSKDGRESDVSLIMGRNFNGSIKKGKDTTMIDLFSRVNMRKIDGIITGANSNAYGTVRSLTLATMDGVQRVDPFDYSFMDSNAGMFYIDPGVYKISKVIYLDNVGVEVLINDGHIQQRSFQGGNKLFSYFLLTSDMSECYASNMVCGAYLKPMGFDEKGGRLFGLTSWQDGIVFFDSQAAVSPGFNPSKLSDFTCLEMLAGQGDGTIRDYHCILENKKTKRRYSYVAIGTSGYDADPTKHGVGKAIIDFDPAKCPGIGDAIAFTTTQTQAVIYYATKNSVYSIGFPDIASISVREEYLVPQGEEITGLKSWDQGGYIEYQNQDPNAAPDKKILEAYAKDRMLMITTYNPTTKKGYIRTVAITNVGSGKLEPNRELHGEFDGFGKISCIAAQK